MCTLPYALELSSEVVVVCHQGYIWIWLPWSYGWTIFLPWAEDWVQLQTFSNDNSNDDNIGVYCTFHHWLSKANQIIQVIHSFFLSSVIFQQYVRRCQSYGPHCGSKQSFHCFPCAYLNFSALESIPQTHLAISVFQLALAPYILLGVVEAVEVVQGLIAPAVRKPWTWRACAKSRTGLNNNTTTDYRCVYFSVGCKEFKKNITITFLATTLAATVSNASLPLNYHHSFIFSKAHINIHAYME